jgi:hypothetical protein
LLFAYAVIRPWPRRTWLATMAWRDPVATLARN